MMQMGIQPKLSYTINANAYTNLYYEMENNYPMHVPRSQDVRCCRRSHMGALPLSKNIVARGLSISRIFIKWPPITVMQQSHANEMMGPIFQSIFLRCCPNG